MPKAYMCPYFRRLKKATNHSPERVICEGGIIRFADDQMRREWMYQYCALDYQRCQIYQTRCKYHNKNRKAEV